MAEDGKIFDSVYFSAKAAEIQFKRLSLLNSPPAGEIEFNGMRIEFLPNGSMKVSGATRIAIEGGDFLISPQV